jgi:hypothetical protein
MAATARMRSGSGGLASMGAVWSMLWARHVITQTAAFKDRRYKKFSCHTPGHICDTLPALGNHRSIWEAKFRTNRGQNQPAGILLTRLR